MAEITERARHMAAELIAKNEGFRSKPYWDPHGHRWTIGYGFTSINGHPVTAFTPPMSELHARTILEANINTLSGDVAADVQVPLTDGQAAALIDLTYNAGPHALDHSLLLEKLNHGDYAGACTQFATWCAAGGRKLIQLVRRRAQEAAMFREPAPDDDPSKEGLY